MPENSYKFVVGPKMLICCVVTNPCNNKSDGKVVFSVAVY